MQSSNSIQIQDVQYPSEQGFCAVVHEPTAYLADIDIHSCTARRLGIYPSHAAAVAACQSFPTISMMSASVISLYDLLKKALLTCFISS